MTSRRQFLILAAGTAAGAAHAQLPSNIAALSKGAMEQAVREVPGGAPRKSGRVKLDVPPLVDNGNVVPIGVTVDSPMTAADHVTAIYVFTEKNPQPKVIGAHLGPRAGRAQ